MRHLQAFLVGLCLSLATMFAAQAAVSVNIDLARQNMTVSENGAELYSWPVSSGAVGRGTPNGQFRPYFLDRNHRSSIYESAPMPYSVFFHGNYAIHGTNAISRLGHAASHGCVRLHPANAATLFALVQKHGMKNVAISIVNRAATSVAVASHHRHHVKAKWAKRHRHHRHHHHRLADAHGHVHAAGV